MGSCGIPGIWGGLCPGCWGCGFAGEFRGVICGTPVVENLGLSKVPLSANGTRALKSLMDSGTFPPKTLLRNDKPSWV